MDPFRNALILTGPTASGKSLLGVELAQRLGAEIISMDSMALYRGLDIGTAKPTAAQRQLVPHHLLDVLDPWESASVAWWLEQAAACCRAIEARGRRVLFVGGTPLYLKALLHGLFDGPPADEAVRRRLSQEANDRGNQALHERLAQVDPPSAARLHPNDVRRVVRALEVWELTGRPISAWQQQWSAPPPSAPDRCLCLDVPRPLLYERIDTRVRQMMDDGLLKEVCRLRDLDRPLSREARQALGYKELLNYLDGGVTLDVAVRQSQTRSRQFAKRQLTWFRQMPACHFVTEELTFARWGLTMEARRPAGDGNLLS
jgi:tRNA dimethylallyltransferase